MIRQFLLAFSLSSLFLSPLAASAASVKAPMKAMGVKVKMKDVKSMAMPKGKMSIMKTGMDGAMNEMSITDAMANNKKMEDMKKMKKMKQAMERKQRLAGTKNMNGMAAGGSSPTKMKRDDLAMAGSDEMPDETAAMGTTMKTDAARMRRMLKMRRMRTAAALASSKSKTASSSAAASGSMQGGETDEGMME